MGRVRATSGHSWSSVLRSTVANPRYGILGPFARGDFVRRVQFTFWRTTAGYFEMGAAWCGTNSESVRSVMGGRGIIERSDRAEEVIAGVRMNVFRTQCLALTQERVDLPVGGGVGEGASYIGVFGMGTEADAWECLVSAVVEPVMYVVGLAPDG